MGWNLFSLLVAGCFYIEGGYFIWSPELQPPHGECIIWEGVFDWGGCIIWEGALPRWRGSLQTGSYFCSHVNFYIVD